MFESKRMVPIQTVKHPFVGTPDAGQFFRVIETHGVNGFFTAPTAIRAIKRDDPAACLAKGYDLSSLRYLFVAGEHCDHGTRVWAEEHFRVPVLNNWWQTETGRSSTEITNGLLVKLFCALF
jgi:acyl-coenzyme A synthetase/AMP-(fatty) acid ligase